MAALTNREGAVGPDQAVMQAAAQAVAKYRPATQMAPHVDAMRVKRSRPAGVQPAVDNDAAFPNVVARDFSAAQTGRAPQQIPIARKVRPEIRHAALRRRPISQPSNR